MSIPHAVLGLLAGGPRHGYEIRAAYEDELVPGASLNVGQVYTTLDRLERDGLVRHEVVEQAERPDKKVFRLTRQGRAELIRWLAGASPPGLDLRDACYLRIALARRLPGRDPRAVVAAERRVGLARLQEVAGALSRLGDDGSIGERLLLERAARRLEGFVAWLDRCEEILAGEDGR